MTHTSGPGEMTQTSRPGEMTQTSVPGENDTDIRTSKYDTDIWTWGNDRQRDWAERRTHTVGLGKRFTVSKSAGNNARVGGAERAFALGSAVKRDGWMTAAAR